MPDVAFCRTGAPAAWLAPPRRPAPQGTDADVWRVDLARSEREVAALCEVLSEDERERADRFVFAADRRRFVVARANLRRSLAGYVRAAPESIVFGYNAHGKPHLARPGAGWPIEFNASHSGDVALIAVAAGRRVGVDVEDARRVIDYAGVAASAFSAEERAALAGLPVVERQAAFFATWTRKEAYLKAIGRGLAHPLDGFSALARPGEGARLRLPAGAGAWRLIDLHPGDGYAAALVVEG